MEDVRGKHRELIEGVTDIYQRLALVNCDLSPDDILYPPHVNPSIHDTELEKLGYDNTAIEVIKQLPWLSNRIVWEDRGFHVAPDTRALNYFVQPGDLHPFHEPLTDPRRGGYDTDEGERPLDPWMLRITDGAREGYHYIYDTKTCKSFAECLSETPSFPTSYTKLSWGECLRTSQGLIVRWRFEYQNGQQVYWYDLEWQSASTVLSEWLQKLRSLEWLPAAILDTAAPGVPPVPMYIAQPPLRQLVAQMAILSVAETEQLQGTKDEMNLYLATECLYLECGWPDEFRSGDFTRRVEQLRQELRPLQQALWMARRRANPAVSAEDFERIKAAAHIAYSGRLNEAAGTDAI